MGNQPLVSLKYDWLSALSALSAPSTREALYGTRTPAVEGDMWMVLSNVWWMRQSWAWGKVGCLLAFHCLMSEPFPEAKGPSTTGTETKYGSLLDLFQSGNWSKQIEHWLWISETCIWIPPWHCDTRQVILRQGPSVFTWERIEKPVEPKQARMTKYGPNEIPL